MTNNILCLDENYSTTRLLTQEQPEIIKGKEDKFETALFLPEGEGRRGEGGLRTKGYFKKSYEDKPLISIVTVVFNGEKFLEETIQSVINQTYDNVEYIIIDGASTDGTIDIIKKYEDKIDYWVSEKDKGMYDGLNKGFSKASGEIFAYLNADDLYSNDYVIESIVETFLNNDASLVFGNVEFINADSKHLYFYKSVKFSKNMIKYLGRVPFAQQTAFWKRDVYNELNGFDDSLKYVADSKFFFSILCNEQYNYKRINKQIAKFRWHDEGFSTAAKKKMSLESESMKKELGLLKNNIYIKVILEIVFKMYNLNNIISKRMK